MSEQNDEYPHWECAQCGGWNLLSDAYCARCRREGHRVRRPADSSGDDIRSLVGYERRLHKMRYTELLTEARRVDADIFKDITRPVLIARILETQGLDDSLLANDPQSWTATIEVTMTASGAQHAENRADGMLDFLVSGYDGVAGAVVKVEPQ